MITFTNIKSIEAENDQILQIHTDGKIIGTHIQKIYQEGDVLKIIGKKDVVRSDDIIIDGNTLNCVIGHNNIVYGSTPMCVIGHGNIINSVETKNVASTDDEKEQIQQYTMKNSSISEIKISGSTNLIMSANIDLNISGIGKLTIQKCSSKQYLVQFNVTLLGSSKFVTDVCPSMITINLFGSSTAKLKGLDKITSMSINEYQ